ncbi:hypothetical protein [Cellulomonas xiejunii]|uniref:EF-hand domain-containing protein n=1 Tax=Cellulomonas xiejunii TaxID=2968083 RepID=A0ABY5KVI2_9CELL|nr:hypothetical protein [Cellulomonas xiejunii]UUI73221.1 hypothetical protein NP048_07235 [Cellulomonas xiejunii]
MAVVIWTLVALLTAAAVLVVASSSTGAANPLTTFRRGVRARRNPDREQAAAAQAAAAAPVDLSLADFLRATASEGDGYLNPDELIEDLRGARERAAAVVRPRRDVVDAHDKAR